MVKKRTILITLILIIVCSLLTAGDLLLASWNVRILSDKSRDDQELSQIASIIDRYDLVAIQEVRDTRVLDRLEQMLPGWDYIASESVGRGVTELYAFFYRTDEISPLSDALTIIDHSDAFIREPAVASFQAGDFDFTLVSNHILFGDSKNQRREEISLLDDVISLIDELNGAEEDVILLGDFNMPASDHSWEMEGFTPLISPNQKTTITDTSSYDNIWLPTGKTYHSEFISVHEIYHFDELLYTDDDTAKREVSDHRPIVARFSTDSDDDASGTYGSLISYVPEGFIPEIIELPADRIYISKVVTTPTNLESVTLYNPTDTTVRLTGWQLGDKNDPKAKTFGNITIHPSTYLEIPHPELGFQINNRDEILYLYDRDGNLVYQWEDD